MLMGSEKLLKHSEPLNALGAQHDRNTKQVERQSSAWPNYKANRGRDESSWDWLRKGDLKKETEELITAAQNLKAKS